MSSQNCWLTVRKTHRDSKGTTQVSPAGPRLCQRLDYFLNLFLQWKESHRHLQPGFPARRLPSASAWRAPSERLFWTAGGCEAKRDGWECLGGFCFCFPALHLLGISLLQGTLCPHHSYSWSSPDTNPDSFCNDSWVKACPVFLFSPAIVFLCQHKWVYSCFIFKTPFFFL